jgi:hypothetical protein
LSLYQILVGHLIYNVFICLLHLLFFSYDRVLYIFVYFSLFREKKHYLELQLPVGSIIYSSSINQFFPLQHQVEPAALTRLDVIKMYVAACRQRGDVILIPVSSTLTEYSPASRSRGGTKAVALPTVNQLPLYNNSWW